MKREILFKAKRVDNNEWVEGDLINGEPTLILNHGEYSDGNYREFNIHPETVCQFTGLLDKNGNKIFEGDIINFSCAINGGFVDSVVEYDSIDGAWSINWDRKSNRVHYFFNEIEECEITSNIHD